MNKKVVIVIIVIAVVTLCIAAVIYTPNLMEFMLRMHKIRPHG